MQGEGELFGPVNIGTGIPVHLMFKGTVIFSYDSMVSLQNIIVALRGKGNISFQYHFYNIKQR